MKKPGLPSAKFSDKGSTLPVAKFLNKDYPVSTFLVNSSFVGVKTITQKILIVDDSRFMRNYIKTFFHNRGYQETIEAKSGEEAVVKYMLHHPALVTMDITLPIINGIEAARKILRRDPDAVVVMCSSIGQTIMIEEALKMGARDFIIKPFRAKEIDLIIDNYLSSKQS